jgi:hypothetical protein
MTEGVVYRAKLHEPNGASVLGFDLPEILAPLEPWGKDLRWTFLWLRGTGKDIVSVEQRVSQSDRGITFSWSELVLFAARIEQVEDAVLIGHNQGHENVTRASWDKQKLSVDIAIEAIDSSYWIISVLDQEAFKALRREFIDIFSDISDPPRPELPAT